MMNWNPRRDSSTPHANSSRRGHSLRVTAVVSTYLAVMALALLWIQPVAAQAVGPVYALPGTLTRAVNRGYDTILTIPNGIQFGLVGQTPEIEAQIVQYRSQGDTVEVKVWGDRYPAAVENDLEYIVVSSIQLAAAVPATPVATPAPSAEPTSAPTAAPTSAPTAEPTSAVPIAVVTAANVNVRSGPGTDYPRVGSLVAGQTCTVTGRNQSATWWQVSCPAMNGWVFGELLALAGPVSSVPVVQTAPPPTPAPPTTFSGWRSEFFGNRDLAGNPLYVSDEPAFDFNWGSGSPASMVPNDNFSGRFERTLNLTYGTYEISVTMDDGARVYIDNSLMINSWNEGGARTRSIQVVLSGAKRFRVEYFEGTGSAQIRFSVNLISSSEAWTATYHNGVGFGSAPILSRGEPRSGSYQLDYNWGRGSPAAGVPIDQFAARWVGNFHFEGGDYRFHATMDDGVRVYIDGILVIDHWINGYYNDITNTFHGLGAGNHQIVVEYYEAYGDALVRVWWERISSGGSASGPGRPRDE